MLGFDRMKKMAISYPDSSPFDMHPPLYNLRPESAQDPPVLDPLLVEVGRDEAALENPFLGLLGTCPLLFGPHLLPSENPFPVPVEPSPLDEVSVESIQIVKLFTMRRTMIDGMYDGPLVFQVEADREMRILKVFPDAERREGRSEVWEESNLWLVDVVNQFRLEKAAYEHLSFYGACDRGAVPRCFGWLYLGKERIQRLGLQGQGAFALLLEYFQDAQPITSRNITINIADQALRRLSDIHAAHVQHGDLRSEGNILLLPEGRVVWVDFNKSVCGERRGATRKRLLRELADCWMYLYNRLIPGRIIDWHET